MSCNANDGRLSLAPSRRGTRLLDFVLYGLFYRCRWFRMLAPGPFGSDREG